MLPSATDIEVPGRARGIRRRSKLAVGSDRYRRPGSGDRHNLRHVSAAWSVNGFNRVVVESFLVLFVCHDAPSYAMYLSSPYTCRRSNAA